MAPRIPGSGIYVEPNPATPGKVSNIPGVGWFTATPTVTCPASVGGSPSPEFLAAIADKAPTLLRQLWVNSVDMSDRVMKWPTIKMDIAKIKTTNMTLSLSNADKGINYLVNSWGALNGPVQVRFGIGHGELCAAEYVTIYGGKISSTSQANSIVRLSLVDNLKAFNDTLVGTEAVPVVYAMQHVSDLIWDLVTTHGGLDSTQSTANTDIDYASWLAWDAFVTLFNMRAAASLPGASIFDAMQDAADIFRTSMIFENGKLSFGSRNFLPAEPTSHIEENKIIRVKTNLDAKQIINDVTINYNYDPATKTYGGSTNATDNNSVLLFGRKSLTKSPTLIWSDALTAIIIDQEHVEEFAYPFIEYAVDGTLALMANKINARITFADVQLDVNSSTFFRVVGREFNLDTGETTPTLKVLV